MAPCRRGASLSRKLSPGERALWRAVALTAAPLPGKRLSPETSAPPPHLRPLTKSAAARHPVTSQPPARPAPVADRAGEKRVRRGRVEIAASFDLHGHTQDRAQRALAAFLLREHVAGARVVIVVTGKGRGGEEGVLKRRLPVWLDGPEIRPLVAGFAQAHRRHGGDGAFYVFLKSRNAPDPQAR